MPTTITILTPENVEVTYELAGLGTRIRAAALDTLLQSMAIIALWIVIALIGIPLGDAMGTWLPAVGTLLTFVIFVGYFLFFETRWNGQTPGKRLTGARVMKDGGFPIDLRAAVVRNVVRLLDLLPGPYAVGFTSSFFSREYKRLGDYAAGTVVVRERPGAAPALELPPLIEDTPANLPRIDELHAIRHFLDRRGDLGANGRQAMARRLALAFGRLLGYPLDQVAAAPEAFLQWLVDETERRQGV